MQKIAARLTDYILAKKVIEEEDYEIYQYGFQTGIEMIICTISCFLIAMKLHMVDECIVLLMILFSLRSYVGGLHMQSFIGCFVCSCTVIFVTLLITKCYPLSPNTSIIIAIVEILLIYCVSPVENKNRPVDEVEKEIFSHMINRILLVIALVVIVSYMVGFCYYLSIITYTLCAIIISIFLGKLKEIH